MITDPALVVAKLRLPAGVSGIDRAMKGLAEMYRGELVIVTAGPLWESGWMIIATHGPVECSWCGRQVAAEDLDEHMEDHRIWNDSPR